MSDKASVTNSAVTEPAGNKTIVTNGSVTESEKELENRIRENLRHEYDEKSKVLEEKIESIKSEKEELESRLNELTNSEKNRLDALDKNLSQAEKQLYELETNPEYAGYNLKIERTAKKTKDEAVSDSIHETSVILMNEFLERKAEEEKISVKQLREELNSVLKVPNSDRIRYPDLMPHERVKMAYMDRLERKEIQKLRDENKRLLAERDGFSEDGTRVPRDSRTVEQLRESHLSGDLKAGEQLAKSLDERQKEYDSQFNK